MTVTVPPSPMLPPALAFTSAPVVMSPPRASSSTSPPSPPSARTIALVVRVPPARTVIWPPSPWRPAIAAGLDPHAAGEDRHQPGAHAEAAPGAHVEAAATEVEGRAGGDRLRRAHHARIGGGRAEVARHRCERDAGGQRGESKQRAETGTRAAHASWPLAQARARAPDHLRRVET